MALPVPFHLLRLEARGLTDLAMAVPATFHLLRLEATEVANPSMTIPVPFSNIRQETTLALHHRTQGLIKEAPEMIFILNVTLIPA